MYPDGELCSPPQVQPYTMFPRALILLPCLLAVSSASLASTPCTLSNVFGDAMVLQRDDATTMVWGFAEPGTTVSAIRKAERCERLWGRRECGPRPNTLHPHYTPSQLQVEVTISGTPGWLTSSPAGADGVWRQALPSTPASDKSTTLTFKCSSGENFALTDVLFGDVHICGAFLFPGELCRIVCAWIQLCLIEEQQRLAADVECVRLGGWLWVAECVWCTGWWWVVGCRRGFAESQRIRVVVLFE